VIERRLIEFGCDLAAFTRVAVTPEQITDMHLTTRPPKEDDRGNKRFFAEHGDDAECVEVEAIPPATLRDLVTARIEDHVDHTIMDEVRAEERDEREMLDRLAERVGEDGGVEWLQDMLDAD
jgi:hypothetical protein